MNSQPRTEKLCFSNGPLEDFPPQYESEVNAELRRFDDHEAHQIHPELLQHPRKTSKRRSYLIISCAVTAILILLATLAGVLATYLNTQRQVRDTTEMSNQSSVVAESISQASTLSTRSMTINTTDVPVATVTVTATLDQTATAVTTDISIMSPASSLPPTAVTIILGSFLTISSKSYLATQPSSSSSVSTTPATIMVASLSSVELSPKSSPTPATLSRSSNEPHPTASVQPKTWIASDTNSISVTKTFTTTDTPSLAEIPAKPTGTKAGGWINFCGVPGMACSD
ncbi:hypothetical protein LTR62_004496 [Meristemomyces frigidus]|uniref:Uncharacterized protein n=1 Tax=Meristemomyces frigidus TaxID=1508187 RepID=A0AAN7THH6_9PEZI|nr:hypothetical protein LTR62_004496 [Meristemomyces frigidus]